MRSVTHKNLAVTKKYPGRKGSRALFSNHFCFCNYFSLRVISSYHMSSSCTQGHDIPFSPSAMLLNTGAKWPLWFGQAFPTKTGKDWSQRRLINVGPANAGEIIQGRTHALCRWTKLWSLARLKKKKVFYVMHCRHSLPVLIFNRNVPFKVPGAIQV